MAVLEGRVCTEQGVCLFYSCVPITLINSGPLCVSVCVLVAQFCLTLFDLMGCRFPDSPDPGILQARILE